MGDIVAFLELFKKSKFTALAVVFAFFTWCFFAKWIEASDRNWSFDLRPIFLLFAAICAMLMIIFGIYALRAARSHPTSTSNAATPTAADNQSVAHTVSNSTQTQTVTCHPSTNFVDRRWTVDRGVIFAFLMITVLVGVLIMSVWHNIHPSPPNFQDEIKPDTLSVYLQEEVECLTMQGNANRNEKNDVIEATYVYTDNLGERVYTLTLQLYVDIDRGVYSKKGDGNKIVIEAEKRGKTYRTSLAAKKSDYSLRLRDETERWVHYRGDLSATLQQYILVKKHPILLQLGEKLPWFSSFCNRLLNDYNSSKREYQDDTIEIRIAGFDFSIPEPSINPSPTPEENFDLLDGPYILDKRYITEEEVYQYSYSDLRDIINAMYARHGFTWDRSDEMDGYDEIRERFWDESWANPLPALSQQLIQDAFFNEYENKNVGVLAQRKRELKP